MKKKGTLLILDDEIFIREMLSEFFLTCDFNVLCAANEKEAYNMISENDIEVALVDLNLGDTDGISVLRRIKQKNMELSVLLMTGYPSIDTSIAALREGAIDYIIKPFRLQEIRETVQRSIKAHREQLEFKLLKDRFGKMKSIIHEGSRELRFKRKSIAESDIINRKARNEFLLNTEGKVESIIDG